MRGLVKFTTVLSWFVFVPALAFAQASITGTVRETDLLEAVTLAERSPR
jgi:hypothetical protein